VAQAIEHLPSKHEALNSNFTIVTKKKKKERKKEETGRVLKSLFRTCPSKI
jgi:hypothetical protein